MIHSPATVISQLLVDLGFATFDKTLATDSKLLAFTSLVPDQPDSVVVAYNTQGLVNWKYMTGDVAESVAFQIMSRTLKDSVGYDFMSTVCAALDRVTGTSVTIDGEVYTVQNVSRTSSILFAGRDDKRRILYTVNGYIQYQ